METRFGQFVVCSEEDPESHEVVVYCENCTRCQVASLKDLRARKVRCSCVIPRKRRAKPGPPCGDVPLGYFRKLKQQASRRGIPFNLTIEDVSARFIAQDKKCELSGLQLYFGNKAEPGTASVDRIDSDLGYEPSNIEIVHKDINRMKWTYSVDKFIWLCKQVANNN